MILTEEILLLQKRAGIITEAEYKQKLSEVDVEDEMFAAMKTAADMIATGADNVKPSPKDGQLQEVGALTLGALVTGAPGLISVLGKGANLIGKAFGKDKTKIGEFLKKKGHQLEEYYLESIGGWLKASNPSKYNDQDPLDKSTPLYDAAHKIYGALLIGAAVVSGYEAGQASGVVQKGVEGGLALLKGKEVLDIGQKIAAA
jgi:hypothetical protein